MVRGLRSTWVLAVLVGCGIRVEPATPSTDGAELTNANDPDFAKRTVRWDREAFPKSAPLVEAAESEKDPVRAEKAFRAALSSIEAERNAESTKGHPDAYGNLFGRAKAGLGMSLHAQNRDLDAALTLADAPYDPGACHATVRARCRQFAEIMLQKFPNMVSDNGAVHLYALPGLLDRATSVESLDMLGRAMARAKGKGPVLIRASITTKESLTGGDVRLKVEGLTSSAFFDRCRRIGTLEIPEEKKTYILERCHKEKATFVGANVVAKTSSADAGGVTEQKELSYEGKGDVLLLVDPATTKRASKTLYDLGTVSVVRAPKRGERF
jgi:hypothetical protein